MSIEEGLEMSLAKVCLDRDALAAQVDGLQRALAQSQASAQGLAALAESLQNRLASRPLSVEDTAALEAENDALRADAERYRWLRSEGLALIKFERLTPDTCDIGLDHAIDAILARPPDATGEKS